MAPRAIRTPSPRRPRPSPQSSPAMSPETLSEESPMANAESNRPDPEIRSLEGLLELSWIMDNLLCVSFKRATNLGILLERFATRRSRTQHTSAAMRQTLFDQGQLPHSAIVGCADSRAPLETIFDAMPGDIFALRNAGNTCTHAEARRDRRE
eukprot:s3489_g1.t1